MGNLRSRDAYAQAAWDWVIFKGCFGTTKIAPTDIDGLVERNGHFLILEAKPEHGFVPKGQEITFQALVATGLFTVLVMWGPNSDPRKAVLYRHNGIRESYDRIDLEGARQIVTDWFEYADKAYSAGRR